MHFSEFFIKRPVLSGVLAIIIVLTGLVSIEVLPISQYPNIVPPDVVVTTIYPGATAEVIADTVAAPLEKEINGVENMLYMRSVSASNGILTLTITFNVGTDPDQATINVSNRVKVAEPRLPLEARRQGIKVQKRSTSFLQVIAMSSELERYDSTFISNYALLNVIDDLKRIEGVGDAILFGARDYSMRVWLKPDKLAEYNLTPIDVATAIREQNSQFATGSLAQEPMVKEPVFTYNLTTKGRLVTTKEFGNILLRSNEDGSSIRVKDIARVELGALDYSSVSSANAKPAVPIGIYLLPGANALKTATAVNKKMEELSKSFPEGIHYAVPFDTTRFVKVSIKDVLKTFAEALILVTLVVYAFLQNVRATLIPVIVIPVSIIGSFAGLLAFGFSMNLLTLFAMILAIGIVVDDAIIVIENVERIMMEEKLGAMEASFKAMQEVSGPVVAIMLVLAAVFVPVAFLGGLIGEMYRQFAITISIAVIISGIMALTLTPALCALIKNPSHHKQPIPPLRWFNAAFAKLTELYLHIVKFFLNHSFTGLAICVLSVIALLFFLKIVPGGLVPDEDQGYVIMSYILPPASSLARTAAVTDEMSKRLKDDESVNTVITITGFDIQTFINKTNTAVSFVTLKPWHDRTDPSLDARNLVNTFAKMGANIDDALIFSFNPPPITGMSTLGGFEGYIQNRSGEGINSLMDMTQKFVDEASKRPEIQSLRNTFSTDTPQYFIDLDREKAHALNIPIDDVYATVQSTFGSLYVNDFTLFGRNYQVSLQSDAPFRERPENLKYVYVRSLNGTLTSLDSLFSMQRVLGPDIMERFNVFPAAKFFGMAAPGYSSGQALKAMEEVAEKVLKEGYSIAWTSSAYQEKIAQGSGLQAFAFGIAMIYLILSALYEKWSFPVAVIVSVPFGALGAIFATWLGGLHNDLYFQIGLVTLIGLSAKNAILIVEFAMMNMQAGMSIIEAATEAARLRFRPIIMTSLAFTFGCLPLIFSRGAGSSSHHAIGTGVVGGMLAATFIATLFIPMFFKLVAQIAQRKKSKVPQLVH